MNRGPEPQQNTAVGVEQDFKDPHIILEIIREHDESIARLMRDKDKMLARYQELMRGYEEHYHTVMNRDPDTVIASAERFPPSHGY